MKTLLVLVRNLARQLINPDVLDVDSEIYD